nr:neuropeptide F receptor-like [Cherax quadricarinatus]
MAPRVSQVADVQPAATKVVPLHPGALHLPCRCSRHYPHSHPCFLLKKNECQRQSWRDLPVVDVRQVIVYPTKKSLQKVGAIGSLLVVWLLSFLLALPNFIWRTLENHHVNLPGIEVVTYCFEDWPLAHGRAYYSILVIVVQYCLPILTVSVAYARICNKLKYRMTNACSSSARSKKEDLRMRKTNTLLVSIALIFCLSWLPLNLYNVVVDLHNPFGEDTESMLIVYSVCHMAGMSSACSNPSLRGRILRKDFLEIFGALCPGALLCRRHLIEQPQRHPSRGSLSPYLCSRQWSLPPNTIKHL